MESPVRICLGAALVVNLLLLSSTTANSSALYETTSPKVKDDRSARYARINSTAWISRNRQKTPDVELNELNPKETVSEEHTEKNAKYKDRGRGRYRYNSQSSTERLRKLKTSTDTPKIISVASKNNAGVPKIMIVTPEPEKKNLTQIIDSMRVYKKTKLPVISSSSTTPLTVVKKEITSNEKEYEDEDEEEEKESFDKYTSSKFGESSNFFTIPGFGDDDDFSHDSATEGTENKLHKDFSIPSYDKFSTYFPNSGDDPYKSDSFFHSFEGELTTPKNDFFDKKFQEISSSIKKNLDSIKAKTPSPNKTNVHKLLKENVDVEKINKGTPTNKSTVIIKNTKEVRLLDNEGASTANQELSDVHGTSIYYEMSVISTETYAIDNLNDDDCDNDTLLYEPTPRAAIAKEVKGNLSEIPSTASTKNTIPSAPRYLKIKEDLPIVLSTKPTYTDGSDSESVSSSSFTSVPSSASTVWSTAQNSILSTEETATSMKVYSSSFTRNRSYSKRLNFNDTKDQNKNTPNGDQAGSNQVYRPVTRKFHYTTPKTKPIWMAPRRNITRQYARTTLPTTIYSEHFNIKDKFSTTSRPRQPTRTVLTTVSSEIDPVQQSDVGGVKKVVHSQSISDNSIPTLWKRGSTKFATSTAASAEEGGSIDLEIPPTNTAWALASLISLPSQASSMVNGSLSPQKSVDDNELQKVGETTDKLEASVRTSTTTTASPTGFSEEFTFKPIAETQQNKLHWRPVFANNSQSAEIQTEKPQTESKSESLPAESNISLQSSAQHITTQISPTGRPFIKADVSAAELIGLTKNPPPWVQVTTTDVENKTVDDVIINNSMPPIGSTKPTGFESITKLPASITTPQGDEITPFTSKSPEYYPGSNTARPTTTDYEITTIRFSYVPQTESSEPIENMQTETATTDIWHPVVPTRTRTTTAKDVPITTYRPIYMTTTESENLHDTTTILRDVSHTESELSSNEPTTTELSDFSKNNNITTTEVPQSIQTDFTLDSNKTSEDSEEETTTTTQDMSTIIVEIRTEINSEREIPANQFTTKSIKGSEETTTESSITNLPEEFSTSEENSDSNEVITQQSSISSSHPTTSIKQETTLPPVVSTEFKRENDEEKSTTEQEPMMETISTHQSNKILDVSTVESTTDFTSTKAVSELEDLTTYNGEVTTEASSRVLTAQEAGSGAAVAIAVSTIGVIALILLIGLLLVVRRRGRRGVYAQRCTPVSLDAYSLDSVSVGHKKGTHRLRASKRSYGNPAYDDEVTSHPMQYAALANFALDVDSMTAEFAEIPSVTVRPDEVPPGCEDKNRYSNVLPLPETRVPLQRIGNDPTTEYINANYVTGPGNIKNYYIACQAPLQNTVADLWRMIWEQNSRLIVMLTEYMENGVEKCYEYLPPSEVSDNRRTFGDFQIILKKREQKEKYAISSVQLINLRTRTWREITHMWYFWPAKGVPDDHDSVIDFLSEMRGYMKILQTAKEYDEEGVEIIYGEQSRSSYHNLSMLRSEEPPGPGVRVYSPRAEEQRRGNNGTLSRMKAASEIDGVRPCTVICASGAGRAAALIALDVCARALASGAADVPRVVRELRAQRPHSLANRHHYIFLYKVLSEYGNKLMGGGVDTI